jgi:hypothetical protein
MARRAADVMRMFLESVSVLETVNLKKVLGESKNNRMLDFVAEDRAYSIYYVMCFLRCVPRTRLPAESSLYLLLDRCIF